MMNEQTEALRQLVDMALACGRKMQNKQTGYVHHCYQLQDDEAHVTIPVVENFLFALALLRTRKVENITEAKGLIEGLLQFQNQDETGHSCGNFPIYLHEYPVCKDRFIGINSALPIYWMLKDYRQVLGGELRGRLETAFLKMLAHSLKMQNEKPAPYPTACKIAAACLAGGVLLKRADIEAAGKQLLDDLLKADNRAAWYCPASLGEVLSALLMVYPRLSESAASPFWKHLEETWHRKTGCYIGPALKEFQSGKEPQVTLYDLFLGYFSRNFSTRALSDSPVHLAAALIQHNDDSFHDPKLPLHLKRSYQDQSWHIVHDHDVAYSVLETDQEIDSLKEKGFHLLRVVWGDNRLAHTLVCQGGNSQTIETSFGPGGVDFTFKLGDPIEEEDREKNREIIFSMDRHHDLSMLIGGVPATTFSFGEVISIQSTTCKLSLTFHLQEGEGTFLGHRMIGNRQSQKTLKGKQRYQAYDWQVFMRTVKRSGPCTIKASLRFNELQRE